MLGEKDTIAAIATAKGTGALGIVRISGDKTPDVLSRCFDAQRFDPSQTHRAFYGFIKDSASEKQVDEVLVLNFTSGHGFTGEASADIICHGGSQVTQLVLDALLGAGARLARPGEFTYRAVMNGKLDLAKAESVLDLINARTPRAAANALKNIRGALSEKIQWLESEIIFVLAHLEASIDFTTEDIQPVNYSDMSERLTRALNEVRALLRTYVPAQLANRGLRVALAGRPNSGKSSLMNALLGRKRSIVADFPGTTRDTVEEEILIADHLFKLVDTAGLRETENVIEAEGVARAKDEIATSDLIMYIVDSSLGLTNDDVREIKSIETSRVVICFNKSDLKQIKVRDELEKFGLTDHPALGSSTLTGSGLDSLRDYLVNSISKVIDSETASVVSTQRQREALLDVEQRLVKSITQVNQNTSPEFVAFELRDAMVKAQEVLGKNTGDDVMDRVFKEFCIGK